MTRIQKVVTVCGFLGAITLFIFLQREEVARPISTQAVETSKILEVPAPYSEGSGDSTTVRETHPVSSFCDDVESFSTADVARKEVFASNTHFKKDGEVYRIRVFVEDGQNTSFKKLVFFKEDDDGFPRIIKDKQKINPSEEEIKSYLEGAAVIHQEADVSIELKDGRSFNYSEVNGKVTKVLDGASGYPCQKN
jgi:hypothetical protein